MDLEAYFEVASTEELQGMLEVANKFLTITCHNRSCHSCPIRQLCVFMTSFQSKCWEEGIRQC